MIYRSISLLMAALVMGPAIGCSGSRNLSSRDDSRLYEWLGPGGLSAPDPSAALWPTPISAPPPSSATAEVRSADTSSIPDVLSSETSSGLMGLLAPFVGEVNWRQESGAVTNDAPAETTEDRLSWRWDVNLYGWLPQAPAQVTVDHNQANLPEDLGTILDSLQAFVMMDIEARKGPFGFYVAPVILFLRDSMHIQGPVQRHRLSIREDAILLDFGVSYEIGRWKLWASAEDGYPRVGDLAELAVEPFVGARWMDDEIKIDLDPGPTLSPTIKFIAPVVGLRTHWRFTEHWGARIEGDFGGFGVDHVKKTYNFDAAVEYRWKAGQGRYWKVFGGYRYLDIHYDDSNKAELQVAIKGPLGGIGIQF